MQDISLIDSNFKVETTIKEQDVRFYDILQPPFQIYGVFHDDGQFRRLPEAVAKSVSEGVHTLHAKTAGGRVRFRTDSAYVAIHAEMPFVSGMPHFAKTGTSGFDLYDGCRFIDNFTPPLNMRDGYESIVYFPTAEMREITVNFPLYSEVSQLYIGLQEGARVAAPTPYKVQTPIVYYGSSITQGACASRPGNAYQSMISRRLDTDFVNLGFSGNAKAEDQIAEYVSNLDMSVFVYDYDHNAPTVEHLKQTHQKMFLRVREKHPDIPIVLMSRPRYYQTEDVLQRLAVIRGTYDAAKAAGDENVYLLDGVTLMSLAQHDGTVDGTHPNDLGFASMAKALGDLLEKIFKETAWNV